MKKFWLDIISGDDNEITQKELTTFIALMLWVFLTIAGGFKIIDISYTIYYGVEGIVLTGIIGAHVRRYKKEHKNNSLKHDTYEANETKHG